MARFFQSNGSNRHRDDHTVRVNLKSATAIVALRNRHAVARYFLTDRLRAKLGEVEQGRDQDDGEHVAACEGDAGHDEDGLRAGHNRENLRHGSPRCLPGSVATAPRGSVNAWAQRRYAMNRTYASCLSEIIPLSFE